MCLYVPRDENIRIANEDMTVYKYIQKCSHDWIPIYFPRQYFPYNTILTARNIEGNSIEHLHILVYQGFNTVREINEGFHSFIPKTSFIKPNPNAICIIPKGSEYCLGQNSDIVSTNLIVFKTKLDYLRYKLFHKLT